MKTRPFNPVSLLETRQDIEAYLQDALHDEDPRVFIAALGNIIRARGVAAVARQAGINRESLYRMLKGQRMPRWDTVARLLDALGIRLEMKMTA